MVKYEQTYKTLPAIHDRICLEYPNLMISMSGRSLSPYDRQESSIWRDSKEAMNFIQNTMLNRNVRILTVSNIVNNLLLSSLFSTCSCRLTIVYFSLIIEVYKLYWILYNPGVDWSVSPGWKLNFISPQCCLFGGYVYCYKFFVTKRNVFVEQAFLSDKH